MKKYDDESATPLAFHKFIWWVSLPVNFFLALVRLCNAFYNMDFNYGAFGIIEILFYMAVIGLAAACFIGFFRWKSYSWYCVILLYFINVVYSAYVTVICVISHLTQSTIVGAQLVVGLIFFVLIGIYYIKRRPLFFQETWNVYASGGGSGSLVKASKAGAADSGAKYCSWCGAALPEGSDFCRECGTPVQKK